MIIVMPLYCGPSNRTERKSMEIVRDILAFVAPTCVIFAAFSYYRTMEVKREFKEMQGKFSTLVSDTSITVANLHHEIETIRQGFIKARHCPACDSDRQASEFGEGDYICKFCREETSEIRP